MVSVHRIESHFTFDSLVDGADEIVRISFDTEYRGYWQASITNVGVNKAQGEPPMESLKGEEQEFVKLVAPIVFRLTTGSWPDYFFESIEGKEDTDSDGQWEYVENIK